MTAELAELSARVTRIEQALIALLTKLADEEDGE